MTKELMLDDTNNYIPFVLDLVAYIVENKYGSQVVQDAKFNSELLSLSISNDYLLFKICDRETIKLDEVLDVDKQINFFIRLATNYNCKISDFKLIAELKILSDNKATLKTIEAIKTHPILTYDSHKNELFFKYDLFEEHFKNIYVGLLIKGQEILGSKLVSILADFNNYNSYFIDILMLRIGGLNDDIKINVISILEGIRNYKTTERNISIEIKNRAISSIFLTILKIIHKSSTNSVDINTNLLKELFATANHVNDFCIIDCNSITSAKIVFDFSGLNVENSIFSNYEYFGDCKFDDKTIFDKCKFESLNLNLSKLYTFKPHNFISPFGSRLSYKKLR